MEPRRPAERLELAVTTPAGPVSTTVELADGFVPVTEIVPLLHRLGQQAQALEQQRIVAAGQRISCTKGCAACCRMLVPVSAPEAFALRERIAALPETRQATLRRRLAESAARLEEAGLLAPLQQIAETDRPLTDDRLEPINRAYYQLQLPCPFLEEEACSIYEDRPAACRELLVTSPAEWCADVLNQPVRTVPVPLRVSTVLGLLWADLTSGPPRLIPLPLALDWADRHAAENRAGWTASRLLEQALDAVWRFLSPPASP
jgi:Fe-S-cluster containining protein